MEPAYWQYTEIDVIHNSGTGRSRELQELGMQGWEAYAIRSADTEEMEADYITVYLKRRVTEDTPLYLEE